ncbi:MAG TPA: inner membrane CreD family protein [Burkholderiales bacterium]
MNRDLITGGEMQKALVWKLSIVLSLCLLATIPLMMVRGVIAERQALRC